MATKTNWLHLEVKRSKVTNGTPSKTIWLPYTALREKSLAVA